MAETSSSSSSGPPSPATSLTSIEEVSPPLHKNPKDITEQDKVVAAELKQRANKAFSENHFALAAALYGEALERNPLDATLFCNRAYTRMKMEENGYAIADATAAIAIDPKYVKAYYRRGQCQLSILKPKLALVDFRMVVRLDPNNALGKAQLEATQKLLKRMQFESAIEVGEEDSTIQRCREIIADGGCNLDTGYTGPKLDSMPPSDPASKKSTYKITDTFVKEMIEWYRSGKALPRRYIWEIVLAVQDIMEKEASMVEVALDDGVTCDIIGDTHGQFYDLLHLLSLTGPPSETHCLLFNGDFVDRGSWSVEVVMTLFAYKWLYPRRVFLNRGNHETKDMNKVYGFEGEVKHKHGELTYKLFSDVFTTLPLSTLLCPTLPPTPTPAGQRQPILSPQGKKRYFVVHGGLFSKDGVTLDDIKKIHRFGKQPGNEGLMCELLWTDPQEAQGRGPSKRGVGIGFGPDVTKRWCELNGVTGIYRSHEVRQDGYAVEHDGLCTTVFSAPNYCDAMGNKGAYVRIDGRGDIKYVQFEAKPHPPMKPMAYASGMSNMMM
ncbi:hypothetical protein FRB94_001665 [Tulasnella sp. JGI-2019a]|nr:hypothetical protein FRB94_001665 [Tulasnella sp. JGI-2019a]KAG9010413.1 hypothetical protein FRB93_004253 [Tulasnella sp. JGI-2019a]